MGRGRRAANQAPAGRAKLLGESVGRALLIAIVAVTALWLIDQAFFAGRYTTPTIILLKKIGIAIIHY
ncbi:MAG: hypothetical protein AB7V46_08470 [Thermomicrobiales bacterium]